MQVNVELPDDRLPDDRPADDRPAGDRRRAREGRWRTAAEVLDQVRLRPGVTRAEVARRLGISSGSATEITARLRELELLSELPAPAHGRGRPTTVLVPHPAGPLVIAVELRHEDWRCAVATLDGTLLDILTGRHPSSKPEPASVLAAPARAVRRLRHTHGARIRALSIAAAGTIDQGRLVQSAALGWGAVDLGMLAGGDDLPTLIGNDATLAGVAEARTGAAAGVATALHLLVEVGIGGALVVGGRPLGGSGGPGGEYGHMPFGDRRLLCPCGARGCWDLEVDGRALARHLGEAPPADPRSFTERVLSRAAAGEAAPARAVGIVAGELGHGIAGLINAHDPDVVTLGGLAPRLRGQGAAEFDRALAEGVMRFRRDRLPPVVDSVHGDDGALQGAAAVALDHVTTESALAGWAETHRRSHRPPHPRH